MNLSLQEKNREALQNFLQWRTEKEKRELEELPDNPEPEGLEEEELIYEEDFKELPTSGTLDTWTGFYKTTEEE